MNFIIRKGPHLVGYGTCPDGTDAPVVLNDGETLEYRDPPEEALTSLPAEGALWNLDTHQWDLPEVPLELRWKQVRYKRDQLLAECDWVTLRAQDTHEPVPQEWLDYRQALRDVTDQTDDPDAIVWPQPPG